MDAIPALVVGVVAVLYYGKRVGDFVLESWLDQWWRDRRRERETEQRRRMLNQLKGE